MQRLPNYTIIGILFFLLCGSSFLCAETVFYGGIAFVGNYSDFDELYPYTFKIVNEDQGTNGTAAKLLYEKVTSVASTLKNMNLETVELANMKDGDSLVMALAIDGESLSTYHVASEELGIDLYKITADLSAQVLVFDYQTKTIVASHPILLRAVSATNGHAPSKEFIQDLFRGFFFNESSPVNLLNVFMETIEKVDISRKKAGRIQVTDVVVEEKSDKWLPEFYKEDKSRLERLLGRNLTKYLADNTGANTLPYLGNSTGLAHEDRNLTNTGAAIGGTMAMRFSGGEIFNLTVPKPDYAFAITLRGFSKSKGKENAGGESWVYGTYVNLKVVQPALNKAYLDANLKNVFVDVVVKGYPSSKEEDWACFNEATTVLMDMLTKQFVSKPDLSWAKANGDGKPTVDGLKRVAGILEKCK